MIVLMYVDLCEFNGDHLKIIIIKNSSLPFTIHHDHEWSSVMIIIGGLEMLI